MKPRNSLFALQSLRAIAGGLALSGLAAGPTGAQAPAAAPAPRALGTPAAPAPTDPWTLQAAVDYALAHNLTVRASDLPATNRSRLRVVPARSSTYSSYA